MTEIAIFLMLATLHSVSGYGVSRGRSASAPSGRSLVFYAIGLPAALAGWILLAQAAQRFGEVSEGYFWEAAEWWAWKGQWFGLAVVMAFLWGATFGLDDTRQAPPVRRALLAFAGVVLVGALLWRVAPTYPFIAATNRLDNLEMTRQSVESTCALVALINYFEIFTNDGRVSERDMARLSGTTSGGTPISAAARAVRSLGYSVAFCRKITMEELEAFGRPAIVSISTLPEVHHATLFVRFEENGARARFIDPDYGWRSITRERFQEVWYGKTSIVGPRDMN